MICNHATDTYDTIALLVLIESLILLKTKEIPSENSIKRRLDLRLTT
jgi:hypothetical protein